MPKLAKFANAPELTEHLGHDALEERIARVVFFVHGDRIGVVHGFIKKTRKTPGPEIELARKRMQEMQA